MENHHSMPLKSRFSDLLAATEYRISAIFWSQEGSINKRQMGMVFTACFTLGVLLKNRQIPPNWATPNGQPMGFLGRNGEGLEIYMLTRDWIMYDYVV